LIYEDQRTSGTVGGTVTTGSWQTKVLNTEVLDTGNHGSLSSNDITLDAGTYSFDAYAEFFQCQVVALRLYNVTDSVVIAQGVNDYGQTSGVPHPRVCGRLVLASSKTIRLQYRADGAGGSTQSQGIPTSWGTEIYTHLELWKQ